MRTNNEIAEELRMLSEVVAGISRFTPYEAPAPGYFESFPSAVLVLAGEEIVLSPALQGLGKGTAYAVPDGYFDRFAAHMLEKVRTGKDNAPPVISRLADPGSSRMADPGSFAGAGGTASPAQELAALSPLLGGLSRKMPFEVPDGYFNGLNPNRLPKNLSKAAEQDQALQENDAELSPLLSGLRSARTYQVPAGYFEDLSGLILTMVTPADSSVRSITNPVEMHAGEQNYAPAKVISIGRGLQRHWWNYAAAAAACILLIVGSIRLFNGDGGFKQSNSGNPAGNPDLTKSLSNVSDQEIQNYLEKQNLPLADELSNSTASIDVSEIPDISDSDVNSMLAEVSDAELNQYMEDLGNAKDLPTN